MAKGSRNNNAASAADSGLLDESGGGPTPHGNGKEFSKPLPAATTTKKLQTASRNRKTAASKESAAAREQREAAGNNAAAANANGSAVGATTNGNGARGANGTNSAGKSKVVAAVSPWLTTPTHILHTYRAAHRLRTPSCFANPHAHHILSGGIGRQSPSMARPRHRQRVQKEQLAIAVRKHFNSLPVNESEAMVNSIYVARSNEKSLRMKFPATKPK